MRAEPRDCGARVGPPYNSATSFARRQFGGPVFRVVVDGGFSCPSRDGTISRDGCLFCSIEGFRPPTSRADLPLEVQVARALPVLRRRYPRAVGYLVYFQPYTNTYAEPERISALISAARRLPGALGVVLGTRPDALPGPVVTELGNAARQGFLQVEIGVQSTDDATLRAMERGHDWAASRAAFARLRAQDIRTGAHVILGTPWESRESQINGAERLSEAGVDSVKLHHLQVLRGSRLAARWTCAPWPLPDWDEYADLAADFLAHLDPGVVVERLFSTGRPAALIAPRWSLSADQVRGEICRRLAERCGYQGGWRGQRAAQAP